MVINRMFKGVALCGALWALNGFAEECKGVVLYSDGNDNGQMIETGRTFPEQPEWKANWGDFGNMVSPYIRLSGIKNVQGDWKGLLSFPSLPLHVDGGVLRLKVRSTQNVRFGVWLKSATSESGIYYAELTADKTHSLEIPLANLGVTGAFDVANVGVGLFQVPQYQYTTLFIDDVGFSCVKNSVEPSSSVSLGNANDVPWEYEFSNAEAWSSSREERLLPALESEFSAAYSLQKKNLLMSKTDADFLVSELEHLKIVNSIRAPEMTAKKSRLTWYDNMYTIVRNRLRENVVANPKQLYFEAEAVAANSDYTVIPLLVADLDYAYNACADSACNTNNVIKAHLLTAGLPTSFVRGSKVSLILDSYFVVTKQRELPSISVCVSGSCKIILPGARLELEFPSTGLQTIVVKMKSGDRNVEQKLFVEVK
ncbi:hypothetical protein [Fibrobacter sp. UWB11]|uniref:hypothetical protein n=1 Tax=Fibrobacter sp. UWB11 TaxID=1896202 RepID=UPI00092639A7|nr:hypothetical protein [Fibrobacter sp. UWB11]SIO27356.1 hypothetical protein SAMN05720758_1892 [Fibrobacter sp. UWB11]